MIGWESYIKHQKSLSRKYTIVNKSRESGPYTVHHPLFNPSSTTLPAQINSGTLVLGLPPVAVLPLPFRRPFFGAAVTASVSDITA